MKKLSTLFVFMALVTFISCKDNKKSNSDDAKDSEKTEQEMDESEDNADDMESKTLTINMSEIAESGAEGEVTFTEEDGKVIMEGEFSGLEPEKELAIHLHENGACDSEDGTTAGGHWNPTEEDHGKWEVTEEFHKGDIGNLEVDEEGNATVNFETDQWCITCDDDKKNIVDKSVIIHADADDFESQPTGDAGDRVSCGVIK